MKTAILFDCEFICLEGSQRRFWCAPIDPDPVIAQIGAVKLGLEDDFPIIDTFQSYVRPIDRFGQRYPLDPFFTKLTGITQKEIDSKGVTLEVALSEFDRFSDGSKFWSWGKDELNMVAISCYVAGIAPPIAAKRFDNAVKLAAAAGMPQETIERTPSNKLAEYYGVQHSSLRGHDALDDALSVTYAVRHLLLTKKLQPEAFNLRSPKAVHN